MSNLLFPAPQEEGIKLLSFLEKRLALPKAMLHRWVREGQCRVNGKRSAPFVKLQAGDQVRVPPFALKMSPGNQLSDYDLTDPLAGLVLPFMLPAILHGQPELPADGLLSLLQVEDDLLVLCKSPGLASQPGTGQVDSVSTRLAAFFAGQAFVPAPVHRLDYGSSGLILAGRSHKAQQWLHSLFAEKSQCGEAGQSIALASGQNAAATLQKEYLVWVHGQWPAQEQLLEDELVVEHLNNGQERIRAVTGQTASGGRKALALAQIFGFLDAGGRFQNSPPTKTAVASLLRIKLITGRKHQLRIQCAKRGHPVIGDQRYGKAQTGSTCLPAVPKGLLLHALALQLPDGRSFQCPPPWPEPFGNITLQTV